MSPRGPSAPLPRPVESAEAIAEGDGRARAVLARLAESAGPDGFLRFDRFVDIALYEPGLGFYERPGVVLGPAGEFYTAAHVVPWFGRSIARRIAREHARAGRPGRFTVVELGAGDGRLAQSILGGLPLELGTEVELTYVIVERSEALARLALARLAEVAGGAEVLRADGLASVGPLHGCVIANELLDALPFRRLVRRGSAWRELGVRRSGERYQWAESDGPAASLPVGLPEAEDGTVLEVSPAAEALVREVADHLAEGVALFVDYGMEEAELLAAHPGGTLAAVRGHRDLPDPLDAPGRSDLSAFVNLTRLRRAARSSGLVELAVRPMREALVDWGIADILEREVSASPGGEAEVRARLAVKNLLIGFDRFVVLELAPPARPAIGGSRRP
jgi:SAM-dependent MidA family methyltransferase